MQARICWFQPLYFLTIMAYAGICGDDNPQMHSDPIFHSISHEEIIDYVIHVACGTETSLDNAVPTVDAGSDFTIPVNTSFILTGTSTATDAGDVLTYLWEERDLDGLQGAALDALDGIGDIVDYVELYFLRRIILKKADVETPN